mmetsp:Transcript_88276/g.189517  ORF Transcript_88276/g.189517 Transcript_88276/m.189517 type:complete len:250 (+) Transcript_88276:41-790(+)
MHHMTPTPGASAPDNRVKLVQRDLGPMVATRTRSWRGARHSSPSTVRPVKPFGTSAARMSRPQRTSKGSLADPFLALTLSKAESNSRKAFPSASLRAKTRFSSSGGVTSSDSSSSPPRALAPPPSSRPRTTRNWSRRCSAVAWRRNMPAPMIFLSISSFSWQRCSMCLSTAESVTRRITRTSLVWPTRCTRATACLSFCGFQSRSKRTTVSAACRLSPTPPARADSKKTETFGSRVKRSMRSRRFSCET